MLGLEAEDMGQLRDWTTALVQFLDNSTDFENASRALSANQHISEYLRAQIDRYRANPADNLISYLLTLQKQNPEISDDDIVGNARDAALDHVTDTQYMSPAGFRFPQRCEGIGRLPRLAHCDEESFVGYQGIPIPKLTGQIHLDGDAGILLDEALAHEACVPCSSAGADVDAIERLHGGVVETHVLEVNIAGL